MRHKSASKSKRKASRDSATAWCQLCQKPFFNHRALSDHEAGRHHVAVQKAFEAYKAEALSNNQTILPPKEFFAKHRFDTIVSSINFIRKSANVKPVDDTLDPDIVAKIRALVDELVTLQGQCNWVPTNRKTLRSATGPKTTTATATTHTPIVQASPSTAASNGIVLLFYKYVHLPDYLVIREWQQQLCEALELRGKIRIAEEGINGSLAGLSRAVELYIYAIGLHPAFRPGTIDFKQSRGDKAAFPSMWVRGCKEIIVLGIDPTELTCEGGGKHLSPTQWHSALTSTAPKGPRSPYIMDCRNWYEAQIGRFKGAQPLLMRRFDEFPALAKELVEKERLTERCVSHYIFVW